MSTELKKVSADVFAVCALEQWARFYFTVERDELLYLDIPEEAIAPVEAARPHLAAFLREINGRPTSPELSRQMIGEFVFKNLEGVENDSGAVGRVFDALPFRVTMRLFSLWLQGHEAMLDERIMPFAEWIGHFDAWRQDEKVKRFAESLVQSGNLEKAPPTVH